MAETDKRNKVGEAGELPKEGIQTEAPSLKAVQARIDSHSGSDGSEFEHLFKEAPARELAPQLPAERFRELIEAQFASLGLESKGVRLPKLELDPGLHGRKILFVDDSLDVLRVFVPRLIVATNGEASFIHCIRSDVHKLSRQIVAAKPDVALIDGELGGSLRGWDVVKKVLAANDQLLCMGFSSDESYEKQFFAAGALGFVHKETANPDQSLLVLSQHVGVMLEEMLEQDSESGQLDDSSDQDETGK